MTASTTVSRPDQTGAPSSFSGATMWWSVVAVLCAAIAVSTWGPGSDSLATNPTLLFSFTIAAAGICVVVATFVLALADRRQLAEMGLLGSGLMAASVMPLVHGLVTPGALYDETSAFRSSAFLTLPIAVMVAMPLVRPDTAFGRWAARRWRDWTLLSLLGVFVLASFVVYFPDAVAAPGPRSPLAIAVALAALAAIGSMSRRQLRLFELGRRPANLVASVSLLGLAGTALTPLVDRAYSPTFWLLHAIGPVAVLVACVALVSAKRMSTPALEVLAPVLTRDPLAAFELGLSPIVRDFVASLGAKHQVTRDHVVRTAEMALRVGERCRLSGRELRDLGLAAMLHDIGKVAVPDEILCKPASLTADEYEVMKRHAERGAEMLQAEPTLASLAPIVRSHHERIDGRGYPDGLVGEQIPVASRIISVCDALDAMTNDREYRKALPTGLAVAVLNEHAGSQWDPKIIAHAVAVLASMPNRAERVAGLDGDLIAEFDLAELLTAVDAEI